MSKIQITIFTQPLRSGRIWHKVIFWAKSNRFEFRVFLLLDLLPHQGWSTQSVLLFTHSWRESNWIHTFPKGISAMWNAISLVQDLNSCCRVHFLRWEPLHHGHLPMTVKKHLLKIQVTVCHLYWTFILFPVAVVLPNCYQYFAKLIFTLHLISNHVNKSDFKWG